jgi:hypothetical protein
LVHKWTRINQLPRSRLTRYVKGNKKFISPRCGESDYLQASYRPKDSDAPCDPDQFDYIISVYLFLKMK